MAYKKLDDDQKHSGMDIQFWATVIVLLGLVFMAIALAASPIIIAVCNNDASWLCMYAIYAMVGIFAWLVWDRG